MQLDVQLASSAYKRSAIACGCWTADENDSIQVGITSSRCQLSLVMDWVLGMHLLVDQASSSAGCLAVVLPGGDMLPASPWRTAAVFYVRVICCFPSCGSLSPSSSFVS